eukprot:scaffold49_cov409-Prasinococcus_capsulatus_cf.AAC.44
MRGYALSWLTGNWQDSLLQLSMTPPIHATTLNVEEVEASFLKGQKRKIEDRNRIKGLQRRLNSQAGSREKHAISRQLGYLSLSADHAPRQIVANLRKGLSLHGVGNQSAGSTHLPVIVRAHTGHRLLGPGEALRFSEYAEPGLRQESDVEELAGRYWVREMADYRCEEAFLCTKQWYHWERLEKLALESEESVLDGAIWPARTAYYMDAGFQRATDTNGPLPIGIVSYLVLLYIGGCNRDSSDHRVEITPRGPLSSGSTANEIDGSSQLLFLHAILSERNDDCLAYSDKLSKEQDAVQNTLLRSCAFPPVLLETLMAASSTSLGDRLLRFVEEHMFAPFLKPHFTRWHAAQMDARVATLLDHLDSCELIIPRL